IRNETTYPIHGKYPLNQNFLCYMKSGRASLCPLGAADLPGSGSPVGMRGKKNEFKHPHGPLNSTY
ncbi:MAG: hypothetical protein ACI4BG_05870, partial [Prevotella sp.]